jgi:hypothetical protein
MKILIRNEQMASHFIYLGLARVFEKSGHQVLFWNQDQKPAFDVFSEFEPDIFIGQGYNLNRATVKCINARPELKVLLKVGIWGPAYDEIDTEEYPVLLTNDKEIQHVKQINNQTVLFNYCHPNRIEFLMKTWNESTGHSIMGLLPAADTLFYKPVEPVDKLKCDIGFVGGYWPYKGRNFDKYLIPLCHPVGKYNVKIFGNQIWPVAQYCGPVSDDTARALFSSATICPNISEPHANVWGWEVNERVFKLAACKAFVISDKVDSLTEDIFTDNELVMADNDEHFKQLIDTFLKNPCMRQGHIDKCYAKVMSEHTYFNRVAQIFEAFEMYDDAAQILKDRWEEICDKK